MSRLPFVRIGVIGLGSDWQETLLPAIWNMQSRVRVVAVYDDLGDAARGVTERLQADVILGVRPLLARRDLDALLVRRVGWQGGWVWDRLREQSRPLWLGRDVALSEPQVETLHHTMVDEGTIIVPELPLRYVPATLRLQELMATTLGQIVRIALHAPAWTLTSGDPLPLSHLLDWCTSLVHRRVIAIEPIPAEAIGCADEGVTLVFEQTRASQHSRKVDILWSDAAMTSSSPPESAGQPAPPLCELACEHGTAVINSRDDVQWTADGQSAQERLASDRTAWEVMLDLFARRVSGGLIPTPDLADLRRARRLACAVEQVRQTGAVVSIH